MNIQKALFLVGHLNHILFIKKKKKKQQKGVCYSNWKIGDRKTFISGMSMSPSCSE